MQTRAEIDGELDELMNIIIFYWYICSNLMANFLLVPVSPRSSQIMTKSGATLTSAQHKVLNDNGTTSFGKTYFQLCQLYSLPVQTHLIHHEPTTLLLDVDKIHKDEDWAPILMALRKSKDLVKISLLSDVKQAKSTSNEAVTRFASGSVKTIVRILPQLMGYVLLENSV